MSTKILIFVSRVNFLILSYILYLFFDFNFNMYLIYLSLLFLSFIFNYYLDEYILSRLYNNSAPRLLTRFDIIKLKKSPFYLYFVEILFNVLMFYFIGYYYFLVILVYLVFYNKFVLLWYFLLSSDRSVRHKNSEYSFLYENYLLIELDINNNLTVYRV